MFIEYKPQLDTQFILSYQKEACVFGLLYSLNADYISVLFSHTNFVFEPWINLYCCFFLSIAAIIG